MMAVKFGVHAGVIVLSVFVFFKTNVLAQETNLTQLSCHCRGNLQKCNESSSSCLAVRTPQTAEISCLLLKEFHQSGLILSFARCLNNELITDHFLICTKPVRIDRNKETGEVTKTTVRVCCQSDFCNADELVDDIIAKLDNDDLPAAFRPQTVGPPGQPAGHSNSPSSTPSPSDSSPSSAAPVYAVIIIVLLSLTVVVIVTVTVVILALHHCMPRRSRRTTKGSGSSIVTVDSNSYSDANLNELTEEYSGSGSGLPLLNKRSISGQITLHNIIGKGRFGEVWKGLYKGDFVAVKIFHTKEEGSWFHEVEIYQTCLLRHPNVLRFIAADNCDVGLQMQLWVITEYCEYGSLYDLLSRGTFSQANALRLCYTAASGLDHLHTEIVGSQCKPAIAHRDMKSRNILVKMGYSCCIADLGLSLTYQQATGLVKTPSRATVGTRRYLAPEILSEEINVKNFESFKRSDIYSFGLVMWEIGRRAECDGHAEEAQLPYFDLIQSDPTLEEVQKVVCQEQRRPSLPNPWNQHEAMVSLSRIIQQCWLHTPEARLTSLRIKKSLASLQELLKDTKESDLQA